MRLVFSLVLIGVGIYVLRNRRAFVAERSRMFEKAFGRPTHEATRRSNLVLFTVGGAIFICAGAAMLVVVLVQAVV
jgi:hypothetical protein